MPKRKKPATTSKIRTSATKAKAGARKSGKSSPRKPVVAKPKSKKRAAKKAPAGKSAPSSKPRKAAKKTTARKHAKKSAVVRGAEMPQAMRLTFSYQGDQVKLVSQQPVDMTVPPSDPVKGYEQHKGFWAEVKGDQDKTLFRRVLHNPTRNDAEVFSDDPEQSISREPAPKRKGVFVVVVPHTEKGHEVTLSRSAGEPEVGPEGTPRGMTAMRSLATGPAIEIARFKLKK